MSGTEDAAILDPEAFGLTDQQAELTARARRLGQEKFAEYSARILLGYAVEMFFSRPYESQ